MAFRTLTKRYTRIAPTRQFAILSFVVIGAITAALCLVISYCLRKDLLDREWGLTAAYIQTEAAFHLSPSDFDLPSSRTAQEHLRLFSRQTAMMPEIVGVKIYDRTATVLWSNERRLIGRRFPDNPNLVSAIAGRSVVGEVGEGAKREQIYESRKFPYLVEVYVPIKFPGVSRVVGVVEASKAPTQVFANIRRGQITVVGMTVAGGLLLYLSLFWIVRRATRHIEAQNRALEQRSRDLVSANEELRVVRTQLEGERMLAAIGEVVAAVAHGIRNPLASIRASAQAAMLECGQCTVSVLGPKNLANTLAQVDRLDTHLKELLHFVRPADRRRVPVDLNAVLRGSLQMMVGRLEEADVKVSEQLAPELPPIMGDEILIQQVFLSLIENAIEAMPNGGGTLTLVTRAKRENAGPAQVFAEVEDTGVGIPPEEIPKILTSFYTTKAQGTGLGLAIAKKFTEAYGGAISVRSCPGEGAAFRVTFPSQPEV